MPSFAHQLISVSELLAIQVIVPETERSTFLFGSVILRCDYTTSANPQEVLVTWRYKSFCKDPVLEYYSTELTCIQPDFYSTTARWKVDPGQASTCPGAVSPCLAGTAAFHNPRRSPPHPRLKADPAGLHLSRSFYQAALSLGQDPANDCPDRQRTVRTVIQKRGVNEPMLGAEYRERKITILNKADLSMTEVMWWDNGVYFCSIDAPGDTLGDSDREIKLIVYHWLSVLFIILGALLLILLLGICCCQCCPQKCCCYVRCPCCPRTCCCPEKVVMQHRMMRDAQNAMAPWMQGQPIYAPISSHGSTQGQPLLYSGSFAEYPTKQNFAMAPMQPMPYFQQPPPPAHHGYHSNGGHQDPNQVLDYLEHQVRGMDHPMMAAQHPVQHLPPAGQHRHLARPLPQAVPFTAGPPSMLSALDEMGVQGVERRVITLPPIVQRPSSLMSRRGPGAGDEVRGGHRISSQSSGSSQQVVGGGRPRRDGRSYREASSPRRGILRGYSDDSDWESRRRGSGGGARGGVRDDRGGLPGRRGGSRTSRPRARSRDDLMEELRRVAPRRERSYSPPGRRGSWSSDEDLRGRLGKGNEWPEKPPSYSSIESQPGQSNGRKHYDRFSVRSASDY
ncbi:hypothetical protein NHX12_006778 [Muraenolepis orangiensis]|uniref:LISCH7 domain-containing protein n=1 Tax=Muraenolepis orangiensis TaxID=630683 RepID=A0A9Q0DQ31_9TELE|nr:hypothetical protein NHX12_006778 [Muraenolepis orangiensis]